jgi:multicomponent Na+:H+ antiporter subunit B
MSGTNRQGMSLIVKTVTECLRGVILLYGIYLIAYGHLTPGGGFPGGVVLASAFVLLTLAEGQRVALRVLSVPVVAELDSVGALVFLGVAVSGLVAAGVFFKNFVVTALEAHFRLVSAGVIPICNLGIGLKVGASLFLVFTVLSALHVVGARTTGGSWTGDRR